MLSVAVMMFSPGLGEEKDRARKAGEEKGRIDPRAEWSGLALVKIAIVQGMSSPGHQPHGLTSPTAPMPRVLSLACSRQ